MSSARWLLPYHNMCTSFGKQRYCVRWNTPPTAILICNRLSVHVLVANRSALCFCFGCVPLPLLFWCDLFPPSAFACRFMIIAVTSCLSQILWFESAVGGPDDSYPSFWFRLVLSQIFWTISSSSLDRASSFCSLRFGHPRWISISLWAVLNSLNLAVNIKTRYLAQL